jgi:hypothetical protein
VFMQLVVRVFHICLCVQCCQHGLIYGLLILAAL